MSRAWLIAFAWQLVLSANGCADDAGPYAHPFGIKPKQEVVPIATPADVQTWRPALNSWKLRFHSVTDFVQAVRQSSFQTLASGKTELIYYAIFRVQPDKFVFASSFLRDEKSNGGFSLRGRNGGQIML